MTRKEIQTATSSEYIGHWLDSVHWAALNDATFADLVSYHLEKYRFNRSLQKDPQPADLRSRP